ncbi:MAG: YjbF family lipoprotein [Paracoccaceae bacterium]
MTALRLIAVLAVTLAAGCSAEFKSDTIALARAAVAPVPGSAAKVALPPERDRLTVRIGTAAGVAFVRQSVTRGSVIWEDTARRQLITKGGALVGTRGFGRDLTHVRQSRDDPVAYPRPLRYWPGETTRAYGIARRDLPAETVVLRCVFDVERGAPSDVARGSSDLVEITETCRSAGGSVDNRFFVDPASGHILRSVQWAGPGVGAITLEFPFSD